VERSKLGSVSYEENLYVNRKFVRRRLTNKIWKQKKKEWIMKEIQRERMKDTLKEKEGKEDK
jgi:hypothetical protein